MDTMHRLINMRNFMHAGVIDPAKVARVALENAASVAGMFLTTEAVVVEEKEDHPADASTGNGWRNARNDVRFSKIYLI